MENGVVNEEHVHEHVKGSEFFDFFVGESVDVVKPIGEHKEVSKVVENCSKETGGSDEEHSFEVEFEFGNKWDRRESLVSSEGCVGEEPEVSLGPTFV